MAKKKSEIIQTDLEKDHLTGPVKQVMMTTYKAHNNGDVIQQGKIIHDYTFRHFNTIITYDENGKKTEAIDFGTNGIEKHVYIHPDQHSDKYDYSMDWTLKNTTKYTFNDQGKIVQTISLSADGNNGWRSIHHFAADGKDLGRQMYLVRNGQELLHERNEVIYDEKGNQLSTTTYDENGKMKHQIRNKYNDKGLRTEYISEWADKKSAQSYQHWTYEYNEHGDCIETTTYDKDGNIKDVYITKHEYDKDGKKIVKPVIPYVPEPGPGGEKGDISETDAYGNWIKKTTSDSKGAKRIYLREFIYHHDPAEKKLRHPLEDLKPKDAQTEDISHTIEELTEEEAKFLAEAANYSPENFPFLRYYALRFKEPASVINYNGPHIEAIALLNELKEVFHAQEIYSHSSMWGGHAEQMHRYTLLFPGQYGYMLHAIQITRHNPDEFEETDDIDIDSDYVYLGHFYLLRPADASENRDEFFEQQLEECIEKCSLRKQPEKPVINIIEVNGNGFAMKEYAVDDNFIIKDLDINYGSGFSKFHHELMHRFNTSHKGLVLFHGQPGTGKTFYIRHLLRKMVASRKQVIYMPPNMVDHLVEPGFMTFLTGEIQDWSSDGYFCVLLIEDAEPLLARRQEGVRIQGITNLLNMSDGLLNDLLNLQIICTFNVDLKKLDSALLRPGRLIARKEFKALPELDANLLAQRLGIRHHFTRPATLAQIYSMRKDHNTLVHDVDPDKNSTTALDDLL